MTSGRTVRQRVRHDLRGPLAVIMGRCEMLLQGAHGDLNEDQERALQVVMRNAQRIQEELEQLAAGLDVSALEQVIPAVAPSE